MTVNLPVQPEAVRDWLRQSRAAERRADALLLGGLLPGETPIDAANRVLGILTEAFVMPPEIEGAYQAWATAYNAEVARHNAEVQARRNAREIAKIRKAACPSCYATHAGEC